MNVISLNAILSNHYKINEIFNKFILAGDKFVPEMHLKQPEFAYIFVDHLIKIDKFEETGDLRDIFKNELDRACFQYHMDYGDFKDLAKRTTSDKVLRDKAFNFVKNSKYYEYQRGLASMVYNFLIKNLLLEEQLKKLKPAIS